MNACGRRLVCVCVTTAAVVVLCRCAGYRTKSILCVPIRDSSDAVIGVLQAINSAHGEFSPLDSEIIQVLASQAGVALANSRLYQESLRAKEKVLACPARAVCVRFSAFMRFRLRRTRL